jgi:hypothetical protein
LVRSRKLIYPAERMLLEKMPVSKGNTSFFAPDVADIPLESRMELTFIAIRVFVQRVQINFKMEISFRIAKYCLIAAQHFFSI